MCIYMLKYLDYSFSLCFGGGGGGGGEAGQRGVVTDLEESGKEQLCTRAYVVAVGGRV